jgi:hypothetical protein
MVSGDQSQRFVAIATRRERHRASTSAARAERACSLSTNWFAAISTPRAVVRPCTGLAGFTNCCVAGAGAVSALSAAAKVPEAFATAAAVARGEADATNATAPCSAAAGGVSGEAILRPSRCGRSSL